MKTTILYIDDEIDNLTSFKAVFRRIYKIDTVASAEEAIELLNEKSYKLIISDQRMPSMTGVELFEKIKEQHPDSIRMILTGYADMQSVIDAINKGNIYHYITKPWNKEEIKVIIDRAIETYDLKEKNQELYKANVMAQYEILKNQINPHFLFNSMNILSTIIPKDAKKAVTFTSQFSKLYRSLLQLRDQQLINLSEELEFVTAFINLQKIRFDSSLEVNLNIEQARKYNIPPFALQLLLENAIKHNIVSEKTPLRVTITKNEDQLIIVNDLNKRKDSTNSTGTGLENLRRRYALLGLSGPLIEETDKVFSVTIPLIEEL